MQFPSMIDPHYRRELAPSLSVIPRARSDSMLGLEAAILSRKRSSSFVVVFAPNTKEAK
jgi:hypothetical protein